MGLVIAKGIVEQHCGTIRVASEGKGKGTSFLVELPLFQVEPKNEVTMARRPSKTPRDPPQLRQVLVVDDVMSNRKMLVRLLERAGSRCQTATNGEEAVEVIRQNLEEENSIPFDAVLMDHEMPELTGPEATETIRRLGYSGVVLGITGNVLKEDIDYFRSKGADEVLAKPVSLAQLQACWEKVSQGNGALRSKHPYGDY